jgi:hypothetical protein
MTVVAAIGTHEELPIFGSVWDTKNSIHSFTKNLALEKNGEHMFFPSTKWRTSRAALEKR